MSLNYSTARSCQTRILRRDRARDGPASALCHQITAALLAHLCRVHGSCGYIKSALPRETFSCGFWIQRVGGILPDIGLQKSFAPQFFR